MFINVQADSILRNSRRQGETGYKIPRGGAFEYVSGANFFGEIVEWFGYAFFANTLTAWAFCLFTMANTIPRALEHHRLVFWITLIFVIRNELHTYMSTGCSIGSRTSF